MEHVSGGWGIVRADWVNHPEVGPDELALLALLSLYAGKDGACWPSQSTLADRLKRSRSWVIRVLNNLEAAGLVTRSQRRAVRGSRATCLYTLVGHAEAVTGTPLTRSDLAAHDRHVAGRRVAGMEQEHQNPAIAGLSHDPHEGSASLSENEQAARTYQGSIRSEPPEDWTPFPCRPSFRHRARARRRRPSFRSPIRRELSKPRLPLCQPQRRVPDLAAALLGETRCRPCRLPNQSSTFPAELSASKAPARRGT